MHLPHLIPAFQHFLWILKVTHSGADLDTAMTMAGGNLDGELRCAGLHCVNVDGQCMLSAVV